MPATFYVELKLPPRRNGTCAVRIRITKDREKAYYNTGKYILPGQWNPAPSSKLHNYVIKHEDAAPYNNAIKNALKGLDAVADANPAATAAGIKQAYERALQPLEEKPETKQPTYFDFAGEYLARRAKVNYGAVYNDKYYVAEYKEVIGNLPLAELFTTRNAHKFLKHLKDKGNGPVTIRNKFRKIGAIYRAGVKEKALPNIGDIFTDLNLVVPRKKKPRPQADQIKKFVAYQPATKLQIMAKAVTMLQYLLQGSRITEALTLKWANVHPDYIEYLPQKNAHKPKFIPRSPLLNKLLNEQTPSGMYVLPYIGEDYESLPVEKRHNRRNRVTREVNSGLKEIGEALGLEVELSSHMFRHAFADALRKNGISIYDAGGMLGHSSYKTTENYFADLELEETSQIALAIFGQLEEPENSGEQ